MFTLPKGKRRLEALAVLVFAATMFTATGQILVEGLRSLLQQENIELNVDGLTLGVLFGTIAVKLILWFICSRFDNITVDALAEGLSSP
jgi:divalent metal cation (Fe/Co/Zn/Cd) transporter